MNVRNQMVIGLFALAAFFPLAFYSSLTHAQQSSVAAPRIDGFDVEPAPQLAAGNELVFTLYGSPGGIARVRIGGATGSLLLDEVEAGVYEGAYTIRKKDRITADGTATANLRLGNKVASAILDESLVSTAVARRPAAAASSQSVMKRSEVK